MFEFDEFIMLTLHYRDKHVGIGQIAYRVIGFGPLHLADCVGKGRELVQRGDNWARSLGVPPEPPSESWTGLDIFCAAGIPIVY
jgi:hypothetical protein